MLHSAGAIIGSKEDLIKGLEALFCNLSAGTLKDNLNLKINSSEDKTLYDTKTETYLKEWIEYLKNQKPRKKTAKSTTKQK